MTTDDLIQMLTGGLTPKERENVQHWIASLPEPDYIEVHHTAAKKYYQLKDGHPDISGKILHYCGLILSAREYGWDTIRGKGYRVAGDSQYSDWQNIRQMRIRNLKTDQNARIKRQLLGHWGEIKEFKQDGVGFRKIAQYLKRYKKLNVSSSYVHKIWREVEERS